MDAAVFVANALRTLDSTVVEAIPRVVGEADEEALHDLRVAIRRLRVLLRIARPIYSKFYANAVRDPFTTFHRATSALRDEEVLELTLGLVRLEDEAFERFKKSRKRRERRLRRDVLDRLDRGELDIARRKLAALLELPVKPKRRQELGLFARKVVGDAKKSVEKLRDTPVKDAVGLHDLRIAYKNLRYATEILEGILPPDLGAMAEPAKKLQTRLGELHDVDVAIATVQSARSLTPAIRARIVRSLRRLRGRRAREYVEVMRPAAPVLP